MYNDLDGIKNNKIQILCEKLRYYILELNIKIL